MSEQRETVGKADGVLPEAEKNQEKKGKADVAAGAEQEKVQTDEKPVEGEKDRRAGDREAAKKAKGRFLRGVSSGRAYIHASFNNTIVSITDMNGNVVAWSSAGRVGFKGSRKSTAYAGGQVGDDAGRQASGRGVREVEGYVQGPGAGRESAVRALQAAGLGVMLIKDTTPVPHDGCRARKRRRV